jgi:hypothetical protein
MDISSDAGAKALATLCELEVVLMCIVASLSRSMQMCRARCRHLAWQTHGGLTLGALKGALCAKLGGRDAM